MYAFLVPVLADSYIHTLNPFLLEFGNGFGIRWYGIAYLSGFLVAWLLVRWLSRTKRILVSPDRVGDFVTALIVGVLVGGRLGHVLLYDPHLLWTFDSSPPFWGLLAIHRGGMASHGGIAGVILACIWMAPRLRVPALHLLDVACFIAPAGLGFGRLANFVNGELWGKALPESMRDPAPWWSIKYPTELIDPGLADPSLLQPLSHLVPPGRDLADALVVAAYQGREEVIERIAPLLTPRYPSQFLQAFTDGVVLLALLVIVWWRPRRPGVVASWFLIGYGLLRFGTEQVRMPDEGVTTFGWLTLPMVLSLLMVLAGVVMNVITSRRPVEPIGGIGPGAATP